MGKRQLFFILLIFYFPALLGQNRTDADSISVYFNIDDFKLNQTSQKTIREFFNQKDSIECIVINAFTDYLGSDEYNIQLSKNRAQSVKSYCLSIIQNIEDSVIVNYYGEQFSSVISHQKGNANDRRVDILLQKTKPKEKDSVVVQNSDIIDLSNTKVGDHFVVEGLNFIGGRHFLTQSSEAKLKKLLTALRENPNIHIEIQGHICCTNGDEEGYDFSTGLDNLSYARALYIYEYLIANGIDASRLSYKGFAGTQKIYPKEQNERQRQANRRVEILITKK
ncbi:MAG: OmpA family protein [Bacteroidales bacterium]|nr:OmpA family protein [Bacteroidales bacterium]